MQHSKELRFGSLLSLVSTLLFSAMLVAQTGTASKDSSSNPVKQRLEQILAHAGQTPAGMEAPPLPARLDPSRDASQNSPMQPKRLPGAPIAASRYVFGRMDLGAGNTPNAVATGAFQTGGPPSIAIANYYSRDGVHSARQC